jgi:xanthine dehydrogenase iron-sulfur cluster and FAD-binding subunit A
LHPGFCDVAVRPAKKQRAAPDSAIRPTRPWPATCAAAPATGRFWPPPNRPAAGAATGPVRCPRAAQTIAQPQGHRSPSQTGELNSGDKRCLLPLTVSDLADLYEACPQARLLAGGTDLALEVTQLHRPLPVMIYVGNVAEMKRIDSLTTASKSAPPSPSPTPTASLNAEYPDFGELLQRFASLQIRNQGTLGGNIGNASPIGDSPPLLIALGAQPRAAQGQHPPQPGHLRTTSLITG